MKILLITPPLLQPNTPYPATPMLTAWLRAQGHDAVQADLSLDLLLTLFSREGLRELFQHLEATASKHRAPEAAGFLEQAEAYLETIEPVMAFLQGRAEWPDMDLPEGPHLARALDQEEKLQWDFRGIGRDDLDRYIASLYLDDVAEAFKVADPDFGFSRYAEHLSEECPDLEHRHRLHPWISEHLERRVDRVLQIHQPEMVVLTVPFPGCLIGALAIARRISHTLRSVRKVLGGGYVNTELRELSDPQIFDYVDSICLDRGMVPLLRLAEGGTPVRTFVRENGAVHFYEDDGTTVPHDLLPAPTYDGLPLDRYFGLFEVLNPVMRLWSDGRWNKLVLAHGCCWSRCAFCDTSIECIRRYDPASPKTIVRWMLQMMVETGDRGFHFVDEALPPDLIDGLCDEILAHDIHVEWWGNIRFEKRFSPELIDKMARAGCIAVTGGLETCCDRTLQLMQKGITVGGAAAVIRNFAEAGILTHAYLMFGFPTQTREELFQGLETVRHLMEAGRLHSVYWHRFALTAHSEIARDPDRFGIRLLPETRTGFARNEIPFEGNFDYDLNAAGAALKKAAYNYNLGIGFEQPAERWFE